MYQVIKIGNFGLTFELHNHEVKHNNVHPEKASRS